MDWQIRAWLTAASAHFGERPDSDSASSSTDKMPAPVNLGITLYYYHMLAYF